jgi:hypothetical protein
MGKTNKATVYEVEAAEGMFSLGSSVDSQVVVDRSSH